VVGFHLQIVPANMPELVIGCDVRDMVKVVEVE
jgi:hypothetical protein